jgi:hypothetical protein
VVGVLADERGRDRGWLVLFPGERAPERWMDRWEILAGVVRRDGLHATSGCFTCTKDAGAAGGVRAGQIGDPPVLALPALPAERPCFGPLG